MPIWLKRQAQNKGRLDVLTVKMTPELKKMVFDYAEQHHLNVSEFVRFALRYVMKKNPRIRYEEAVP